MHGGLQLHNQGADGVQSRLLFGGGCDGVRRDLSRGVFVREHGGHPLQQRLFFLPGDNVCLHPVSCRISVHGHDGNRLRSGHVLGCGGHRLLAVSRGFSLPHGHDCAVCTG